jgi:hypothetical protein
MTRQQCFNKAWLNFDEQLEENTNTHKEIVFSVS